MSIDITTLALAKEYTNRLFVFQHTGSSKCCYLRNTTAIHSPTYKAIAGNKIAKEVI